MMTTFLREQARVRTEQPASMLSRVLNLDFAHPLAFAALAMAYVISRAPFVNISYGTDPDAWRLALTGFWLWDHGEFYPSRLPGYPVPELGTALVVKGGYLATNSLTVIISIIGLWFFAAIVSKLQVPNRALAVAGFAFTPLIWINSMTTMDYMWALTFTLGAYYFVIERRSFLAGVMLGLAIGSRSTAALMLVPLAAYMWRDGLKHELRPFTVTVLSAALIAWIPVYWKYGLSFLDFYDSRVGYLNVLRLLGKDTLGLLGAMAVIAATVVSLPRLIRLPRDAIRDKHVMVWVLAITMTAFSFARLPHEAAYLIPVYPFGFLIMARYFNRYVFAAAVSVIVLAGFVDLTSPGDEINSEAFTNAQLGRGLILSNSDTMRAQISYTDDLIARDFEPDTVVAVGFVYPMLAVRERDHLQIGILRKDKDAISQLSDLGKAYDEERRILYVWLLDYDEFQTKKNQGAHIWYTLDAGRSSVGLHGYRPGLYDAKLLDLGRLPSGGSGAARTDR